MTDTPESSKPEAEDAAKGPAQDTPPPAPAKPVKPEQPAAAAAPVKPQLKLSPDTSKTSAPTASAPASTKPISITPKPSAAKPAPAASSSITVDEAPAEKKPSVVGIVIDGLAAAIAVTFTILILQDVMPFL